MPEGTAYLAALLATGLLLGLRHALDADHVVAVATLLRRSARPATVLWYGATWGFGHTFTLLLTGLVVLTLRRAIPEGVASLFEGTVGLMLIVLGVAAIVRPAAADAGGEHDAPPLRRVGLRPFAVGMVHGLAGSAALMLLVLSTVPSVGLGVVYVLVFGLGSVGGMLLFSGVLAVPLALLARHDRFYRHVRTAVGGVSIVLGLSIVAAHAPV